MSSLPQNKTEYSMSWPSEGTQQVDPAPNVRDSNAGPCAQLADGQPESIGRSTISLALIGPDEDRRAAAVQALRSCAGCAVCEFASYPPGLDAVAPMLQANYDVIIIDLDSDPEFALDLVENIGANTAATVMVYSSSSDPELLVRCMRAGAREFLSLPFEPEVMAEALVRAAARRPSQRESGKAAGRLLTFVGAKGGAGATMLACNFAVALAQDKSQKTLLIDLDLPLGDAALNLGIIAEYSAIEALQATDRLDARFLSQLLVKHSSGLFVLAAPGRFVPFQTGEESIDRLIAVARSQFDNVILDLGSKLDLMGTAAFKDAESVYLVTQSSIPELRNSNRLISQFFSGPKPRLEIVINRFESRTLGVSDEHIAKALTRPVQWKIPNDYQTVRNMQINATPLVLGDTSIARQIKKMANVFIGEVTEPPVKKKGFRLF